MTNLGLDGKRVIVTGAAGGLGRAFAHAFAGAGARVLVADVNADGMAETVAQIIAAGGQAYAAAVDVTRAPGCDAVAQWAVETMAASMCWSATPPCTAGWNAAPLPRLMRRCGTG